MSQINPLFRRKSGSARQKTVGIAQEESKSSENLTDVSVPADGTTSELSTASLTQAAATLESELALTASPVADCVAEVDSPLIERKQFPGPIDTNAVESAKDAPATVMEPGELSTGLGEAVLSAAVSASSENCDAFVARAVTIPVADAAVVLTQVDADTVDVIDTTAESAGLGHMLPPLRSAPPVPPALDASSEGAVSENRDNPSSEGGPGSDVPAPAFDTPEPVAGDALALSSHTAAVAEAVPVELPTDAADGSVVDDQLLAQQQLQAALQRVETMRLEKSLLRLVRAFSDSAAESTKPSADDVDVAVDQAILALVETKELRHQLAQAGVQHTVMLSERTALMELTRALSAKVAELTQRSAALQTEVESLTANKQSSVWNDIIAVGGVGITPPSATAAGLWSSHSPVLARKAADASAASKRAGVRPRTVVSHHARSASLSPRAQHRLSVPPATHLPKPQAVLPAGVPSRVLAASVACDTPQSTAAASLPGLLLSPDVQVVTVYSAANDSRSHATGDLLSNSPLRSSQTLAAASAASHVAEPLRLSASHTTPARQASRPSPVYAQLQHGATVRSLDAAQQPMSEQLSEQRWVQSSQPPPQQLSQSVLPHGQTELHLQPQTEPQSQPQCDIVIASTSTSPRTPAAIATTAAATTGESAVGTDAATTATAAAPSPRGRPLSRALLPPAASTDSPPPPPSRRSSVATPSTTNANDGDRSARSGRSAGVEQLLGQNGSGDEALTVLLEERLNLQEELLRADAHVTMLAEKNVLLSRTVVSLLSELDSLVTERQL